MLPSSTKNVEPLKTEVMIYILTIVVSLLCAWVSLQSVIYIYKKFNWLDKPGARKNHIKPVPAAGGVAIFLAFILVSVLIPDIQQAVSNNSSLFLATGALVLVGAIDDRYNLSSVLRLFLQIGCSAFIAFAFVKVESLHGLFGVAELTTSMQWVLTILILVGVINAYNMMDGIDGLAGSFSTIITVSLIIAGWWLGVDEWTLVLVAMSCSLLMFLRFNWRPARIFMGDSGSMPLGFMFASIGLYLLQCAHEPAQQHTILVLITGLFIVPVIDTLRLFKYRMSRGRSPFSADRNHLHHWLLRNKMQHSQATIRIVILQLITLAMGLTLIQWLSPTWVVIIQGGVVVLFTYVSRRIASFFKWYGVIRRMEMSAFKDN
jgi:UDP-GlcNAc:undecaprenyl-phosphate/decaprenyl-phosphate GlcNAc-1-phosphate transferase